jgi:hypothetical protein
MQLKRLVTGLYLMSHFSFALAGGLSPWSFGMSKAEVASFTGQGPYKSFSNGDLETYNGEFDGHKENVQFFFEGDSLRRIGVYLYEGEDARQAAEAWRRAYVSLTKQYGTVDIPALRKTTTSGPLAPEVLAIAAGANTDAVGKTQMAPLKQPGDMFVFSSFARDVIEGKVIYTVIVYLDRPSDR